LILSSDQSTSPHSQIRDAHNSTYLKGSTSYEAIQGTPGGTKSFTQTYKGAQFKQNQPMHRFQGYGHDVRGTLGWAGMLKMDLWPIHD